MNEPVLRPLGSINYVSNGNSVDYGSNADSDDGDLFDGDEDFKRNYRTRD